MTQIEYIGTGALQHLGEAVARYAPKKLLLVTGKTSYEASGAAPQVGAALQGLEVLQWSELGRVTLEEDVQQGIQLYGSFAPDLVVAVGGGHVLDVAKAVNYLADRKPLIAIPTTAGSGSEATQFAVVYKDGKKTSLESPELLPTVAIVDPALSLAAPRTTALPSALDALAQAIESWWAHGATDESRIYAQEAMQLVWEHLVPAIEERSADAMDAVARGAHLAGKAINISKTTACHALSYGLTYRFGIPHGTAVALTLPHLMRFNGVALPHPSITPDTLRALLNRFAITNLSQFGVRESDIESLAGEVNVERLSNNPRSLTREDVVRIYTEIL